MSYTDNRDHLLERLGVSRPLTEEKTAIRAVNFFFLVFDPVIVEGASRNIEERLYFEGLVRDGYVKRESGEAITRIEWTDAHKVHAQGHFDRRWKLAAKRGRGVILYMQKAALVEIEWK